MNLKNLFNISPKKSKIDVRDINDSSVNIFNIQSDSGSINQLIGSFLGDKKDDLINFHKNSTELIFKNDSALLQANNISYRVKTVKKILDKWGEKTWLNIEGGFDTGKSQLSLLLKNELNCPCTWISLKGLSEPEFNQKILYIATNVLSNTVSTSEQSSNDVSQLIIFDDLPQIGNNDQINTIFIQLVNYCSQNNKKILSTSNYKLHSKVKNVVNDVFHEIKIPLLTKEETLEVIKTYTTNEISLKYLDSICSVSQGYPIYLQVICKYLEAKNWALNVDEIFQFLSGKAFNTLSDETYQKLLSTTEDDSARELLYRLNIVFGDINSDIIKLVSKAKPVITKPFEKVLKLTGTWLQKNEDLTYSISPLIKRLGKENLTNETIIEVNNLLGKAILDKDNKSQYDVQYALLHFIDGESYEKAGVLFVSVLQFYITKPELFKESGLDIFWSTMPLPSGMSVKLKILIRTLQLNIESDLKASNNINYKKEQRDYLRNDLEYLLSNESDLEEFEILFSKLILFKSYLLENGKKAIEYLSIYSSVLKNLNNSEVEIAREVFSGSLWLLLYDLESFDDLEIWFENYSLINKPIEEYDNKSVELFSKIICDNLVSKNKDVEETLRILDFIFEESNSKNLEILGAFSSRAKINIICDKLNDLKRANRYFTQIYSRFKSDLALFLIQEEFGRQQYYFNEKEDSLETLEKAIKIDVKYISKIDAYLTIAKIHGEEDNHLAHDYCKQALDYAQSRIEISNLSIIKLKGEYATSLWFIDELKESIYTLSGAYEDLLQSYNELDEFDDINDYNITVLRIGSVLNYILQVVENGVPPEKIFDGSDYAPPTRGMFNSSYDVKLLNDYYYEERKYLVVFVLVKAFEYYNDFENAIKCGNAGHSIPPSPGQSEHSWPVKVSHPRRTKVSHFWT